MTQAMEESTTVSIDEIDALLPQTQCTLCGFPRCRDYAEALHRGTTDTNLCPPGGVPTARALASTLKLAEKSPCEDFKGREMARIREADCIGCTLCLDPCPVDAIIGAAKHMHSVLEANCTGCGLCVPFCPVDCIDMVADSKNVTGEFWTSFEMHEVSRWRKLADQHFARMSHRENTKPDSMAPDHRKQLIRDSVNLVRRKRWKKTRKSNECIQET